MADELISVEVAYATSEKQALISLTLPASSTAQQAINASGILQQFPEIDLPVLKVGIFGIACKLDQTLSSGDRIEIYRPLQQVPMDARRKRVHSQ